ncbi:sigma 54-interacting transcriptional regulator [Aliikangiella sp. IMCC44359]|uniref:sigma 54-interacting transcriptional regulator n=1 Tax=Aliikangiella sp. IMCC44359 TaxID=3459125 RepID=UPI00403AEFC6
MPDELENIETLRYEIIDKINSISSTATNESIVPALIIQSHPDLDRIGDIYWMNELLTGKSLALNRNYPDFKNTGSLIGLSLSDPYISRKPIHLSLLKNGKIQLNCSESSIKVLINNTLITSSLEITNEQLAIGVAIELSERITLLLKSLPQNKVYAKEHFNMIGNSPLINAVKIQLENLKGIDEPVLIRGATGVGKELIAEAIYQKSNRVGKPFVKVNLGAIPSSLAAAELFGTQKGAFTGADKERAGFFVTANQGTLFLDEIGEAPIEVQSMLLRVLETGELYPVGSNTPKKVNVRIIAATDAKLEMLGQKDQFKLPLLHRLASYEIHLPSLNERKEDIGLLLIHFIKQQISDFEAYYRQKQSESIVPWLSTKLMSLLLNYHWPGNIRQLKNITKQLLINSSQSNQLIISQQIQERLTSDEETQSISSKSLETKVSKRKPSTVSCHELEKGLEENLWEIQATASQLNISRTSIYELMKRYNLKTPVDFNTDEIMQSYKHCNQQLDLMVADLKISKHALTRRIKELGLTLK